MTDVPAPKSVVDLYNNVESAVQWLSGLSGESGWLVQKVRDEAESLGRKVESYRQAIEDLEFIYMRPIPLFRHLNAELADFVKKYETVLYVNKDVQNLVRLGATKKNYWDRELAAWRSVLKRTKDEE